MHDLAIVADCVSRGLGDHNWNLPPHLGVIFFHDDEDAAVIGFPVREEAWRELGAPDVIRLIADCVRRAPVAMPATTSAVGVTVCLETWTGIIPPSATAEEADDFRRWCETHSVADHPWGHASRDVWVAGFDGTLHHVDHLRHTGIHNLHSYTTGNVAPIDPLVDALQTFAGAVKDATLGTPGGTR
jgi:hypothetical protein